jgi:hypothetical protein
MYHICPFEHPYATEIHVRSHICPIECPYPTGIHVPYLPYWVPLSYRNTCTLFSLLSAPIWQEYMYRFFPIECPYPTGIHVPYLSYGVPLSYRPWNFLLAHLYSEGTVKGYWTNRKMAKVECLRGCVSYLHLVTDIYTIVKHVMIIYTCRKLHMVKKQKNGTKVAYFRDCIRFLFGGRGGGSFQLSVLGTVQDFLLGSICFGFFFQLIFYVSMQ